MELGNKESLHLTSLVKRSHRWAGLITIIIQFAIQFVWLIEMRAPMRIWYPVN